MVDDRSAAWAYAALLAAMLISSGNFLLGNLAVRDIEPLTLAFWRTAIAPACVLPFAIPARHDIAIYFRRQKARALVLTLTGVVLPAWLMYRALRFDDLIDLGVAYTLIPLLVVLFYFFIATRVPLGNLSKNALTSAGPVQPSAFAAASVAAPTRSGAAFASGL